MRLWHIIAVSVFTIGFIGRVECARAAEATGTNAPTGVYVSLSDVPERFTVDLKTNRITYKQPGRCLEVG